MTQERRAFEREEVNIPFIFSLGDRTSIQDGEWFEAQTIDIGPVLVGGIAFYTSCPVAIGERVSIALFMDLEMKQLWRDDSNQVPVYSGKILRVQQENAQYKVAVCFDGYEEEIERQLDKSQAI